MLGRLRIATLNTLADSYTPYGDYRHAPANLMQLGARIEPLAKLITNLNTDIIGLQEVEEPLAARLSEDNWQSVWSQKEDAPDGCLTLIRQGIVVDNSETLRFGDGSGHLAQIIKVDGIAVANTHIKWEMSNRIAQVQELIARLAAERFAALMGDINDRPGEPARKLIAKAGFKNILKEDTPTAYIANREGSASLDLLAVRGLQAELIPVELGSDFTISEIPSNRCPSDHIPILAEVIAPPQA